MDDQREISTARDGTRVLVCRAGARLCALPLSRVAEILRPLPVTALSDAPEVVLGLSVIRGVPLPVVDLAALFDSRRAGSGSERFVSVKLGERRAALAVDEVLGIRELRANALSELPPLLSHAQDDRVARIAQLDGEMLLVLRAAHLVPDAVWSALPTAGGMA